MLQGLFLVLVGLALVPEAQAQRRTVEFLGGDNTVVTREGGSVVRRVTGNVHVRQDTTDIFADEAVQNVARGEILFTGGVVVTTPSDRLQADRLRYDTNARVGEATGNVLIADGDDALLSGPSARYDRTARIATFRAGGRVVTAEGDTLTAPSGTYDLRNRIVTVTGAFRLVESGGAILTAREGVYDLENRRAQAEGDVRLSDSLVVLTSLRGVYDASARRADFADSVRVEEPASVLEADAVTHFRETRVTLAEGRVWLVRFGDEDPEAADSLRADSLRADSLRADSLREDSQQADSLRTGPSGTDPLASPASAPRVPGLAADRDTTRQTILVGHRAYNDEREGYSRVTGSPDGDPEGRPLLIGLRADSTGAVDTLLVRALTIESVPLDRVGDRRADGTRVIAQDNVLIVQADFAARADSVVVDRATALGPPGSAPPVLPAAAPLEADALDALSRDAVARDTALRDSLGQTGLPDSLMARFEVPAAFRDSLASDSSLVLAKVPEDAPPPAPLPAQVVPSDSSAAPPLPPVDPVADSLAAVPLTPLEAPLQVLWLYRAPAVWYDESQLTGDTLRVVAREADGGRLDTLDVYGTGFAAQLDSTLNRVRQIRGPRLRALFDGDDLRTLAVWPRAEAIYFSASPEGTLDQATRALADSMTFRFRDGDLESLHIARGVEGTVYEAEIVPDPFRLDGYRFEPDARPLRPTILPPGLLSPLTLKPLARRDSAVADSLAPPDSLQAAPPDTPAPPDTTAVPEAGSDAGTDSGLQSQPSGLRRPGAPRPAPRWRRPTRSPRP